MLSPLPAVIVTCADAEGNSNMLTVAWVGTACTNPPMCYISVRPERHSYNMIRQTMEFTINLTTATMARATDLVGVKSGRDCDKWQLTGLTPEPGRMVQCPSIAQSPVSIECRVKSVVPLGSHDMFLAEVVGVSADEQYFDPETDRFDLEAANLICYTHGHYYDQGTRLGHFGFSVKKPSK